MHYYYEYTEQRHGLRKITHIHILDVFRIYHNLFIAFRLFLREDAYSINSESTI